MLAGGIAGLVVSLGVAFAMYHLGKRINIAVFFTVIGALLIAFAAGILVDAVQNLQELGWLPLLTHPLWNTAHILSEDSTAGDIFHSFLGYSDSPTVLQGIVYVTYLVATVGAFLMVQPRPAPARPAPETSVAAGR